MGIFSGFNSIGRINVLIKQIEPKLDYIVGEINYPATANVERLRIECGTISVLMSEMMDIVGNSPRSVFLAPYYMEGHKMSLMEISNYVASIIQQAEMIINA